MLFVVLQLLMLVELCVVVGVCGVMLWFVVRCVMFVVRCRCVLLVVVAVY